MVRAPGVAQFVFQLRSKINYAFDATFHPRLLGGAWRLFRSYRDIKVGAWRLTHHESESLPHNMYILKNCHLPPSTQPIQYDPTDWRNEGGGEFLVLTFGAVFGHTLPPHTQTALRFKISYIQYKLCVCSVWWQCGSKNQNQHYTQSRIIFNIGTFQDLY
jgi:hypothetical protein